MKSVLIKNNKVGITTSMWFSGFSREKYNKHENETSWSKQKI
jgi:hypothetical protein